MVIWTGLHGIQPQFCVYICRPERLPGKDHFDVTQLIPDTSRAQEVSEHNRDLSGRLVHSRHTKRTLLAKSFRLGTCLLPQIKNRSFPRTDGENVKQR